MDKLELKKRLEELAGEVDDLAEDVQEAEPSDLDDLAETEDLAAENMHLQAENDLLRQRVKSLEAELAEANEAITVAHMVGVEKGKDEIRQARKSASLFT